MQSNLLSCLPLFLGLFGVFSAASGAMTSGAMTSGAMNSGAGEERPSFWKRIEKEVDQGGVRPEFEVVLAHMASVDQSRGKDPNRLSRVSRALAEPWTPPALAAELRAMLEPPALPKSKESLSETVEGIADWLDLKEYSAPGASSAHEGLQELDRLWGHVMDPEREGLVLLQDLSATIELAHFLVQEALSGLEPEQQTILFEGTRGFLQAWHHNHFPGEQLTPEEDQSLANFKSILVVPKTKRALLLGVASGLLRLSNADFLRTLGRRLAKVHEPDAPGEFGVNVMAQVGSEACNRVLLYGKRGSPHEAAAALTIDLGGNDTYARAAVVDDPDMLVSIVIDLAGDDIYQGEEAGPAASMGGVALLVDRSGNDQYSAKRFGLGASALGFACLVDQKGDDQYSSEDFTQGFAVCGVGLLVDFRGDDTYKAWAFAQGAGIGYGLASLVDGAGNDSYLADLVWPDVYGNSGPDVYHGASQGYSTGIRSDVAGGIAALLDLGDGKDRYQAGSFSQGGGYFFSFGLKFDGGGDDETYGSRYAQGFGVHQAVGVLWDAGGDDLYSARSVAHAGMAWDEGVGYLLEDGGNDRYATGDLSCGGAAQTGIAICIDRGGADHYQTGRQSQGGCGSSEYHNKPSIGVLLDSGHKQDHYSAEGRADKTVRITNGVEVFVDR